MSAFVRIQWLHNQLINNCFPNAKKLSLQFEISHRQGQRDIEYLRDSLGAPIEYEGRSKGYKYQNDFVLPTYFVDKNDQFILNRISEYYTGLERVGRAEYSGYSDLLKRLSGNTNKPLQGWTHPVSPYHAVIEFLEDRHNFPLIQNFCVKELSDCRKEYEFDDPNLFLGIVLSSGTRFSILSPGWLRERFVSYIQNLSQDNSK